MRHPLVRWDDLWLNEGFANWMQTFCSDRLYTDWHILDSLRTRFRMELSLSFFLVVCLSYDFCVYFFAESWRFSELSRVIKSMRKS